MSKANATKHRETVSFPKRSIQYLQAHIIACKMGFHHLAKAPLATLTTIIAIGVCLALPMSLYLFIKNIHQFSHGWDQHSSMTLYLETKTSIQQVNTIIHKAKDYPFVVKAIYINPDAALKEFQESSQLGDLLSLLNENPLPGAINIELNPKAGSADALYAMRDTLTKLPKVASASFDYDWVQKLHTLLAFGKALSHFLYLLIGLGAMLMVGNTIRLALERHRDEIEVLNLVGATQSFIRRPFLYRGVLFGALAGVVATLILRLAIMFLKTPTEELVSLYQGLFRLNSLSLADTLLFLLASACLGWLGASLAFMQQQRAFTSES